VLGTDAMKSSLNLKDLQQVYLAALELPRF